MRVIVATILLVAAATPSLQVQLCGSLCDGDDAGRAGNPRVAHTETLFGRSIDILISDSNNVGFARISSGDPGDEVWVDRSFDGGKAWEGRVGNAAIPANSRTAQTGVFNLDGDLTNKQIGIVRACGKPNDRVEIACTPWYRSTAHAGSPAEAAATTLMMFYNKASGQWDGAGWWNNANILTAIIDYMKVTGDRTYQFTVDTTFEKNKGAFEGNFCNDYLDDTGWWGLAWVDAYDLTGNQKYLDTAKITADCMYKYVDNVCGGGVFWSQDKNYKNAITNELFIKLAAILHNRLPGDTKYLNQAIDIWKWFDASGMINSGNTINDGLDGNCKNNNGITWTYNQGVILGALLELNAATGDGNYLTRAKAIADAATKSSYLNPTGVLHEPCDHDGIDCGGDGPTFKGVFARNLGELNGGLNDKPYSAYIRHNGDVVYQNRNSFNEFGLHYEGPFEFFTTSAHASAFEMLIAQERLNRS